MTRKTPFAVTTDSTYLGVTAPLSWSVLLLHRCVDIHNNKSPAITVGESPNMTLNLTMCSLEGSSMMQEAIHRSVATNLKLNPVKCNIAFCTVISQLLLSFGKRICLALNFEKQLTEIITLL
ncbi:MAG: hypothetical protein IPL16_07370 [Ignavibacteria bacterium]|nr:hypothetical protein [Ignavibacteria bacterium]